ncbi:MAG: glycosyltransferase family 2 protein [Lachnospiraceae bacterium]|nr:glycosyltransferase family 2 protein [Lachnospiraceae bacterium]
MEEKKEQTTEELQKELEEAQYQNLLLSTRLSELQELAEDKQRQIDRIKNSTPWKLSKPLRVCMHWAKRQSSRIRNLGGPRGIARKLKSKGIEKRARVQHGTASFPNEEEAARQRERKFSKDICISILVPLYNTPKDFLKDTLDAVRNQTYENWELCLADGSDAEHGYVGEYCSEIANQDPRVKYEKLEKNMGISGNTNACLAMATGSYIGLYDHDDILHPSALYYYMEAICDEDADYIYCDETTFHGSSVDNMITLHFKPDFSPDNLRANNYICHFSVFKRSLLEGTELFRTQFDGSQDHDMILRLTARAQHIVHIPRILYYWRSHKGSVAADISAKEYAIEAAKGAVADHLRSLGYDNFRIESTRAFETIFRIHYPLLRSAKVSILIPNREQKDVLKRCIDSILEKTTYPDYEILVVENNSSSAGIFAYYEELKKHPKIRVLTYKGEFNYSKVNNFAAKEASGEYLLLLNNDTEVITLNWLEELLMYAERDDVGAVGAKLYYPDRTIQHAGIVLGLGAHRTAGHSHYRVNYENLGYMGRLCYAQDVSAVTGACLMVKKSRYEEVGGLDEGFRVALNDVDFCLKLREKGYLNIWTPFCELFHYESASRGTDLSGPGAERYEQECEVFRKKWKEILAKGDPYYNVNFSLDRSDYSLKEAK